MKNLEKMEKKSVGKVGCGKSRVWEKSSVAKVGVAKVQCGKWGVGIVRVGNVCVGRVHLPNCHREMYIHNTYNCLQSGPPSKLCQNTVTVDFV